MEVKDSKYFIGIDLGTSNTVVSYAKNTHNPEEKAEFKIFQIPQIVKPGEILKKDILPSFIYFPAENEKNNDRFSLPWKDDETFIIGEYARKRGGEIPSRQISSAKSWLCASNVEREEKILPWKSEDVSEKFSPVRVQAEILNHIKNAWDYEFAREDKSLSFVFQNITITIPASFDTVARELTLKACRQAGIENPVLMEEPQAAFYAWLLSNGDNWRKIIKSNDLVLVCDIGGGTSDFSLIRVSDDNGELGLERTAVGNHLLVGGDNMDLALVYLLESKLSGAGKKLDKWQKRSLLNKAREAKEFLFDNPSEEKAKIIIHGKGSKLIGNTIQTEILSSELEQIVKNGFFPSCSKNSFPENKRKSGLMEKGLNYESDPAITKHIALFLDNNENNFNPTHILFNGGVTKSDNIKKHISQIIKGWTKGEEIEELANIKTEYFVALGASYYSFIKENGGVRIKSGLNRTYYVEVASSMPAIPGIPVPTKALCIAPFGMEEGSILKIRDNQYMLTLGEEISFNLLGSSFKTDDNAGDIIEDFKGNLEEVAEIETFLEGEKGEQVPVVLEVHATEVGTLDFYCACVNDEKKWKLEFNLRADND
ncbi:MAG: nucleotide-binding protein [Deltaproteobacteria bacterium]|nr:MAG: nucleotide-binding protein [Deltaproteobacteria bacterium]